MLFFNTDENCYQQNLGTDAEPKIECVQSTVNGLVPLVSTLACNGDLVANLENLINNSHILAFDEESSVFTDVGCCTPAGGGDYANCVNNQVGTINIKLTVPTGSNPPTYTVSSPDVYGYGLFNFENASSTSLYYKNSAAVAGESFRFLFYFRVDPGSPSHATIVAGLGNSPDGDISSVANGT